MNYAANAYAKTSHSALSPREAESAVLLKAAQKLIGASQGLASGDAGRINEALSFNQRVDRKSTRLNSSHSGESRMPSSA